MPKIIQLTIALISPLLLGGVVLATEKPRSQAILECMYGNLPDSVIADRFKLIHVNRLGEPTEYLLQAHAQRKEERLEVSAQIKEPASMSGGAYLLRAKPDNYQIYLYVPSVGQIRRLSGDSLSQSTFLGTDLSWEDLQLMYYALMQGSLSVRGEAAYQGRPIDQLLLIPSPETQTAYTRIYLDVDRESCLPLEVRLESSNGEIVKKLIIDPNTLQQLRGKYWYATSLRLENLKEGTHTLIEVVRELVADERLRRQLFNPSQFHVAR